MISLDGLLTVRAVHEGECDSERCPLVLQELNNAISMEKVATVELD